MSAWPPITALVPHAGPMLLIERILAYDGESIRVESVITKDHAFFQPGQGVPAYVGLELMAQAVCAWDGLRRWEIGQAPAVGFLLGTRRYITARPFFFEGERLRIEAVTQLKDASLGSFACEIIGKSEVKLASGVVSVYRAREEGPEMMGPAGANE